MSIQKINNLNIHENPATNTNQFDIENYLNHNWEEIKEVVNNNADELQTIQDKQTTQKQDILDLKQKDTEIDEEQQTQNTDIENLKKENIELREENKSLRNDLNNLIPTVKGEGEDITLEGTAEATFKKLEVGGNSWQETREGYNLFPPTLQNGDTQIVQLHCNVSLNNDEFSFLATSSDMYFGNSLADGYPYRENYGIKIDVKNKTKISFLLTNTEFKKNFITAFNDENISIESKSYSSNKGAYDVPEGASYIIFRFGMSDSVEGTTYKTKIMVYEGTEEKPYEQYGSMPSPEFISPIRNCGDNVNLIPFDDLEETIKYGLTYSIKNGIITLNGTATDNFNIFGKDFELNDGVYTINRITEGNYSKASSTNNGGFILQKKNEDSYVEKEGLYFNISDINAKKTNSFEKGIYRPRIYIDRGNVYENFVIKPKLEQGTKATHWSPHGCGSVNFKVENKEFLNSSSNIYSFEANIDNLKTIGKINLKQGKKYYISYNVDNDTTSNTRNTPLLKIDKNFYYQNQTENFNLKKGRKVWEFTPEISGEYDLNYWVHTSNVAVSISDFMVSVSSDIGYTPHQEQSISFPTKPGQVFHKGDYLADDGVHQIGNTIELDGEKNKFIAKHESIQTDTRGFFAFSIQDCEKKYEIKSNCKCNYLKVTKKGAAQAILEDCLYTEANTIYFYASLPYTTLEEANNWLKEKKAKGIPVKIEYIMQEEKIEPFSEEQKETHEQIKKLKSYGEVTHIFSDDEIKPIIKAEAFADISKLLNPTPAAQDTPLTDEPSIEEPQMEDIPEAEQPQIESPEIESTEERGVESE